MPSPASATSKRKRTSASAVAPADAVQPSSRDAAGEELVESGAGPVHNTRHHRRQTSSVDTGSNPPNKRARTRGNTANSITSGTPAAASSSNAEQRDQGEPSSTTEESPGIAKKSTHTKRASRSASNAQNNGEELVDPGEREPGSKGSRTMKDVPKAGLVHPRGGYTTNPPPEGRPVRVYADGVFDLFHLGHMRQLEQAKTAFPDTYLIVGVTGDAETHRRKGLTVLTGAERAETVRHCKWVDEVLPNCPWIVTTEFLEEHKIDYVAHDDEPYGADEGDDIYGPIKAQGKFLVTQRTEGVSTTGIITKVVRDYEKYILRQFKRGTSRQELNVSWLKKNELDIKRHVAELRDSIKHNWTSAGGEIGRDLRTFWQHAGVPGISRPNSPAPLRRVPSGGHLTVDTAANNLAAPKSPIEHLKTLEMPTPIRPDTPGRSALSRSEDFAAGYSLGLVGSIKSWMQRSRGVSQNPSPQESEEEDLARSPTSDAGDSKPTPVVRGRKSTRSLKEKRDLMDVIH